MPLLAELRQQHLVGADEHVDGAVADLEGGDVRQEVVADEEAQEDEVVDHALEVVAGGGEQLLVLHPHGLHRPHERGVDEAAHERALEVVDHPDTLERRGEDERRRKLARGALLTRVLEEILRAERKADAQQRRAPADVLYDALHDAA